MDRGELAKLAQRGLCLLRLSRSDWRRLADARQGLQSFSLMFRHNVAQEARRFGLCLVTSDGDSTPLRLGVIRSKQAAGTLHSRVKFDLVRAVAPQFLGELSGAIDEKRFSRGLQRLASAKPRLSAVTPGLAVRVLKALADEPANATTLRRLYAYGSKPTRYRDARALQHDALSLALRAFGGRGPATALQFGDSDTALSSVRVLEDAVIEHDARWIPDWKLIDSKPTGRATFENGRSRLDVFTANKRPLEELFGVDLIYFHRDRGSVVMLQYKMLDVESAGQKPGTDWIVPLNRQFDAELQRMQRFDRETADNGPYRLHPGAFYFKFVRRNSESSSAGIIVSLGHVEELIAEGKHARTGSQLRISFERLNGHYLRSESLVALIDSGYIGTRGSTTEDLRSIIQATIDGGRAAVVALQRTLKV